MRAKRYSSSFTALFALLLLFSVADSLSANSLRFDGIDDYCEIPPSPSHNIGGQITIEAWIYWQGENSVSNVQIILNKDWIAYEIGIGEKVGNGKFLWALGDISTSAPDVSGGWRDGGEIPRNSWVHVAVTYDGNQTRTYVNGESTGSHSASGKIRQLPNAPVRIGMRDLAGYPSYFKGHIAEVRLWNIARSGDSIRESMGHSLGGDESGLVAYWKVNEGSGNFLDDSSPNINTARLGSTTGEDDFDPEWLPLDPFGDNDPPTAPMVSIIPTLPTTADDLICLATGSIDPEGGVVSYDYKWFINEQPWTEVTGSTMASTYTKKGDLVRCNVTPSDGVLTGPAASASVLIRNSTPTVPVVSILPPNPTPYDGLAVWLESEAVDPDGDLVLYLFEWFARNLEGTWRRRPELSGTLPPHYPHYSPGEPEISSLYTQIGEGWRVSVSTIEVEQDETDFTKESKTFEKGNLVNQLFSSVVTVMPDFNNDRQVTSSDLLTLWDLIGKPKSEVEQSLQGSVFESNAPANSALSPNILLNLGGQSWYGPGK